MLIVAGARVRKVKLPSQTSSSSSSQPNASSVDGDAAPVTVEQLISNAIDLGFD